MLRFIIFQEENMYNLCVIRRGILIVNLGGDLDHHVTEMIRDEIDRKINGQKVHTITFNFRNVSFMDSAGIGLLMGRYRKIKEIGGEIYVSNIGQGVQRIFRMSGLFKILKTSREMDCFVNEGGQNEQI